jgi:hypothetical protein
MPKFSVTVEYQIDADNHEEAAFLTCQKMMNEPPPTTFVVTDAAGIAGRLELDRDGANKFAATDQTADPGNW